MNVKRLPLIILILLSLSCNAVTRAISPAAPTPSSTPEPSVTSLADSLYIPPACQGRAVATLPPATQMAEATLGAGTEAEISKETQLRVFDELSGTITKVYLYPD